MIICAHCCSDRFRRFSESSKGGNWQDVKRKEASAGRPGVVDVAALSPARRKLSSTY